MVHYNEVTSEFIKNNPNLFTRFRYSHDGRLSSLKYEWSGEKTDIMTYYFAFFDGKIVARGNTPASIEAAYEKHLKMCAEMPEMVKGTWPMQFPK